MKRFLRISNCLISICVTAVLIVCFLYAGFALWDNQQLYVAAENVYEEMNQIREEYDLNDSDQEDIATQFQKLQEINPDVNAWITVLNTGIDYPVVQGIHNLSYINTDVYGNFSLSGSIYLDTRNERDYSSVYSLLYGHNFANHSMFSDIILYKDEGYFNEHLEGVMYLPDQGHILQTVSFFLTEASNSTLFNPDNWESITNEKLLNTVQQDAMYISETGLEALKNKLENGEQPHLLALSTCSSESDEARTILLMLIDP